MIVNYQDKVAINENPGIADINKVKAQDMNEIKNAFNTQVGPGWYNMPINVTLTYSSYDSTNHIGVLNSNADLTSYLGVGTKLRFNNIGVAKYGIIIAITSSNITIYLGTQSISEGAIESLFYSIVEMPFGFPNYMNSLDKLFLPIEIPVGMYHNKPLYRRMIEGNRSGSQETIIFYSSWNVDEFKIILVQNYSNSGQYYYGAPYYANADDQYRVYTETNDKRININCGVNFPGQTGKYICMAEYTKTTD